MSKKTAKAAKEEDDIEIDEESHVEETEDVEVKGDDSDLQVEVEDDTPEEDRNRDRRPKGAEPDIPDDDEVEQYSEQVQKRIKKLKWEFHEERRAKEEAARIRDEALNFAKAQQAEAAKLRRILSEGEKSLTENAKARYEGELAAAKAEYRKAYEEGDAEAIIEAQTKIAKITSEAQRWENYQPQYSEENLRRQEQQQYVPRQQTQRPQPSHRAQEWADRNPWFMRDKRMTAYAMALHQEMVEDKYIDPNSDEYYETLDRELQKAFPDQLKRKSNGTDRQQRSRSPGNVVAPPSRTSGNPRKVKLTATQVQVAKRLGLTKEQYAQQMLKEQAEDG